MSALVQEGAAGRLVMCAICDAHHGARNEQSRQRGEARTRSAGHCRRSIAAHRPRDHAQTRVLGANTRLLGDPKNKMWGGDPDPKRARLDQAQYGASAAVHIINSRALREREKAGASDAAASKPMMVPPPDAQNRGRSRPPTRRRCSSSNGSSTKA